MRRATHTKDPKDSGQVVLAQISEQQPVPQLIQDSLQNALSAPRPRRRRIPTIRIMHTQVSHLKSIKAADPILPWRPHTFLPSSSQNSLSYLRT